MSVPAQLTIINGVITDCINKSTATYAEIPSGVTSIGGGAFYGCSKLTSITLPSSLTSIGGGNNTGGVFQGCTGLKSITVPSSLTTIGNQAFYECTILKSISIPAVTSIGNQAFYGCTALTSITIPAVTSIGNQAFYGCTKLQVTFTNAKNLTQIGTDIFTDTSYFLTWSVDLLLLIKNGAKLI